MNIPPPLITILEAIVDAGGAPRFVGGTVRDHILGIQSKDWDVEVSEMQPTELYEVLSRFGEVDAVGKAFGVFKLHHLNADFSLPRKENRIGAGHKDFNVITDPSLSVVERCRRRDLTMNAMEMNPFTSEIADPFCGREDILRGRMRATDPEKFVEDELRAVRVAQFVSRFPDMVPDAELVNLCSKANLSHLPGERLWEEFRKMFLKGSRPDLGLEFLKAAGLLKFFPELAACVGCEQHPVFHAEGDVFTHTKMVLRVASSFRTGDEEHDTILMFAALCHDFGKPPTTRWSSEKGRLVSNGHDEEGVAPAKAFLSRLTAPNWVIDAVAVLVREHLVPFMLIKQKAGPSAYRRLARRMKGVSLNLLAEVANADSEGRICYDEQHQTREDIALFLRRAEEAGIQNLKAPPEDVVRGRDLLAKGLAPSPLIGIILSRCRDVQDESGLKDPEAILKIVLPEFKNVTS